MAESETEETEQDQETTEAEDLVNRNQELIESLREQQREKIAQELLEQLPQGEGSGLDADKLDGLHAHEILSEIRKVRMPPPVAPSAGAGEMAIHGNEKHNPVMEEYGEVKGVVVDDAAIGNGKALTYIVASGKLEYVTPAGAGDMTKAEYATVEAGHVDTALNAEKLEGSSKAQVQDHAPKAHTHPVAELTDHNKAAHDELDIDADTVDGAHLSDLATDAELATHAGLESVHHTKFTTTEHDTTDRHALGTIVPHDALASLTEKSHTNLTDKGTNTHPQIDTHLAASAPHSGHEVTSAKDQANGYAGLSAGSKLAAGQMPTGKVTITLTFSIPDTLTTGQKKQRLLAPCAITLTKVRVVVDTAPTGANLIVDVHTGTGAGTTIFTTQGNRPTIVAGSKTGVSVAPDVTSIAEGDEFNVFIDQIGSTIAGADLTIEVVGTQTVTFT